MDLDELLAQTRQYIATTTPRVTDLVAAIPDPAVLAPDSSWTLRDFAAHLVVVSGLLTDIAQGEPSPVDSFEPARHKAEMARRNADIAETDPVKLSRLLADGVEGFLDATSDVAGGTPVIFHGANPFTVAGVAGVLLGEEILHGYDIATAVGRPWPIDPGAAALVLAAYAPGFGFVTNPETTRGHCAGYGIELRGVGEMTVRFTDGVYGLEEAGGVVDCTLSADPVAFLMVGAGRLSRYEAIALGLLSIGGNRPDLAVSFPDLFLFP